MILGNRSAENDQTSGHGSDDGHGDGGDGRKAEERGSFMGSWAGSIQRVETTTKVLMEKLKEFSRVDVREAGELKGGK